MHILDRIEKAIFLLLIFSIPFQMRVFLWSAGVVWGFNEWQSVFLYATDILIAALFFLWAGRHLGHFAQSCVQPPHRFRRGPAENGGGASLYETSGQNARGVSIFFSKLRSDTPILLVVFLVVGFVSIFFAAHGEIGVYRWVKLVEFVGLFFYVGYILPKVRFSHVTMVFVASGLAQSFIAIGQFSLQQSLGFKLLGESPLIVSNPAVAHIVTSGGIYIRAYGTFPSPNVLAAFLSVVIFFLLYWYVAGRGMFPHNLSQHWLFSRSSEASLRRGGRKPPTAPGGGPSRRGFENLLKERLARPPLPSLLINSFTLVSLVSLMFALFLTFSRGVLLVFLVASVLFFVLLFLSSHRRRAAAALVFFMVSVALVVGLMWPELSSRFTASNPTNDAAVTERLFFNEVAYQEIIIRPWSGVGLGNFTFFYRDFFPNLPSHLYQPVHNIFLLMGAEMGIVALGLFMIFFIKMLGVRIAYFLARGNKQGEHALFVAVLTFILLSGFIDHYYLTLQQGSLLFWIILGMAYYNKRNKDSTEIL